MVAVATMVALRRAAARSLLVVLLRLLAFRNPAALLRHRPVPLLLRLAVLRPRLAVHKLLAAVQIMAARRVARPAAAVVRTATMAATTVEIGRAHV